MNTIVEAIKQTYFSEQIVEPAILDTLVKYQTNPRKLRKELGRLNVGGISDVIRKTVSYTIKLQQDDNDSVVAELQSENNALVNANESLTNDTQIVTLTQDNAELVRENNALVYANTGILSENAVLLQANQTTEADKAVLVLQNGILIEANRQLTYDKRDLEQVNTGIINENNVLIEANRNLEIRADGLQDSNRILIEQIATRPILITELENKIASLEQTNTTLSTNYEKTINAAETRISNLETMVAELTQAKTTAETRISDLETMLTQPVSITPNITIPLQIVGIHG